MRRFESILIDRANLRMPGLHVLRFAVHRHLPEHASVEAHRHAWCQAIVYLDGLGEQTIGLRRARVAPGTLVVLPPGEPHAFVRRRSRLPMCVLIDFRLRGSRHRPAAVRLLNRAELAEIQQSVSWLRRVQGERAAALQWEGAIAVLQVLCTALRAAGWIERTAPESQPGRAAALAPVLEHVRSGTLADAVRQSGYHRDHLNRLVKAETGLTLGQHRAQQRLATAKRMLSEGIRVAEVAAAVGLPDAGYFARWFRRQTGEQPSRWKGAEGGFGKAEILKR